MSNTVKNPILLKIKFKHDFHLLPIISRYSKMDCSAMYCHYWAAPGKTYFDAQTIILASHQRS